MDVVAGLGLELDIQSAKILFRGPDCLQSAVFTGVTVMRFSSSHSGRNSLLPTGGSLPPSSYVNT